MFKIDLDNPMWDWEYENFRDEKLIEEIKQEENNMNKTNNWILTDNDSYQYVKEIDKDIFELIEMCLINPETKEYLVYQDKIDVSNYLEECREEIGSILYSYGYGWTGKEDVEFNNAEDAIKEVIKIYPNASQIIAECIFEYYGTFRANHLFAEAEESCKKFIKNYIKNH